MAKFPITSNDSRQSIADALNYTLSGPSGLGQNFKGFSSSTPASLTGNFRPPFTQTGIANLFVAPIALSTSEWVDGRTFKMTFAATQATPPFALGNNLDQTGTDIGFYNGSWGNIGVVECTTTYVIVRTQQSYPNPGTGNGGTIEYNRNGVFLSTDCNAKVTVDSGTARVFVSGQISAQIDYECSVPSNMYYTVAINRYDGQPNNDPINPEYIFNFDTTLASRQYYFGSDPTHNRVNGFTVSGTSANIVSATSYTVPTTTVSSSGSLFSLVVNLPAGVTSYSADTISIFDPGQQYNVGDTVKVLGTNLGGASPDNDMAITITSVTTGNAIYPAVNDLVETIFTNVIDTPGPGFYWYILEVEFTPLDGDIEVVTYNIGASGLETQAPRGLTAQVVKE